MADAERVERLLEERADWRRARRGGLFRRRKEPERDWHELQAELLEAYRGLDATGGREVAEFALSELDEDNREDALEELAALVPGAFEGLHTRLLEERIEQHELFRGAPADARDELIRRLASGEVRDSFAMLALAWIGDERVREVFATRDDGAHWATEGGWELLPDGGRRDLHRQEAYGLRWADGDEPTGPVRVIVRPAGRCPLCGDPGVGLFDLDLSDDRLRFLEGELRRLVVPFCDRCIYHYGPAMLSRVGDDGVGLLDELNERQPDFEVVDEYRLPSAPLELGERRRTPYEHEAWPLQGRASQIGGAPHWLQSADYPSCPDCGRPMPFIAQLETSQLGEALEGIHYAFHCADCRTAAVVYQQT